MDASSVGEIDGWIEKLYACKPLSEQEIRRLCEKVRATKLGFWAVDLRRAYWPAAFLLSGFDCEILWLVFCATDFVVIEGRNNVMETRGAVRIQVERSSFAFWPVY